MNESDKYQLIRRIGFGPNGPVYVAAGAAGEVAIRQFQSDKVALPGDRERFLAAGRQQLTLTDPSIVQTLEVIDGPEEASVVMEYVHAETLQTALLTRTFHFAETNALLRRVALALDFAHSRGVVHGDLKPSNIFLLPNQEVMVGDFAISLNARRDPQQPLPLNLRHGYLSPEHFAIPMLLEARSDQYSLATIAYEMYTGHLPFGVAPDHISPILAKEMRPPVVDPALPAGVDVPLMRALSSNPAHRFNSCIEFISDLSANLVTAPNTTKRKRGIPALILGLAALLAIAAGYAYLRPGTKPKPQQTQDAARIQTAAPVLAVPKEGIADKKSKSGKGGPSAKTPVLTIVPPPTIRATALPPPGTMLPTMKTNVSRPVVPPPPKVIIEVLSRARRIEDGSSFAIDEPTLGELGHGDLKALVRVDESPAPPSHLTIEWTVNGVVTDRRKPVLPNEAIEYNNEPTSGTYKVTVRLDGSPIQDFIFRITP